jgi:ribosomal protein S18 acetylase RimI-like enzyme
MVAQQIDTETILIPGVPAIPGLSFRRFRGEPDYPNMVAVIAGSAKADRIERVDTVEDVTRNYSHLKNCDPARDMVFVEIDGGVVGYSRCFWMQEEATRTRVYMSFGFLLPEWRHKGIGRAVLHHNQRRLREIAAEHPNDGERLFGSFASSTEVETTRLLLSDGYTVAATGAIMVRPDLENIPDAPLPAGLEIRPVKEEHLRAIHAAELEAFRDHWGFAEEMEPDFDAFLDEPYTDLSLWRVAWDGDQIVGMVRSFIHEAENLEYERLRGWTEHISVRKPWRRQGVARALLCDSLRAVRERGMSEAALGVHVENPNGAFRLYEGVGFQVDRMDGEYRKPMG